MDTHAGDQYGLGDPLMLERIDKLFACGVGEHVDLPQIVVIGDQSSGKSSVLEGLIRMPLPRDSGLCTRFATQIVFRRASQESISVNIIAGVNASVEHRARVEAWTKSNITSLDSAAFSDIMEEVHQVMGLTQADEDAFGKPTFSDDVLRLEIAGPHQEHLSVIDVPGIFKTTTPGLTTKGDIPLVRNMVLGYMNNPRSVMLTVIPANADVATQEILELAKDVDPDGDRTLGVLTKPDLVDKGAESRIIDLIEGRSRKMKLGWHVVRNPGQQNMSDPSLDRGSLELNFFRSTTPWDRLDKGKVGIESLRERLKEVLSGLVSREFPRVQQEVSKKLAVAQKQLDALGPARASAAAQASFLTELASRFQRLVGLALDAQYGRDEIFDAQPALRIAPAVVARMNAFEQDMARGGYEYAFCSREAGSDSDPAEEDDEAVDPDKGAFETRKEDDLDAVVEILHGTQQLPPAKAYGIQTWLREIYEGGRGFELGTFDASILATTMKKQSSKWISISLGFVSDVIVIAHRFITTALHSICGDPHVRDALVAIMSDGLVERYRTALGQVSFLLTVERDGVPMTVNHYFNDNLQKSRQARLVSAMARVSIDNCSHGTVVPLQDAVQTCPMSNTEHTIQDIHDILEAYCKVAWKRFADNVCQQAASHYLLNGPDSPLALFSPMFVSSLSPEELQHVAGEAPRVHRARTQLKKEIVSLAAARKILTRG